MVLYSYSVMQWIFHELRGWDISKFSFNDAWGQVGFFKVHMITGLRLPLRLPHVLFVEMLLESLL